MPGFKMAQHSRATSFRLDEYTPRNKAKYRRWIVQCRYHGCLRKKTVNFTSSFGDVQPIAWLCAWEKQGSCIEASSHCARGCRVPWSAVEDWADSLNMSKKAQPLLDSLAED